ncbi:MAG: hypothetical protein KatS3mg102_2487 [Planctomycetota bacterium]|nr:MAG: hypothetical protein KatS3mg102_2487 [Planctomycetota bacterium]
MKSGGDARAPPPEVRWPPCARAGAPARAGPPRYFLKRIAVP